jgi:hypothetical protein
LVLKIRVIENQIVVPAEKDRNVVLNPGARARTLVGFDRSCIRLVQTTWIAGVATV